MSKEVLPKEGGCGMFRIKTSMKLLMRIVIFLLIGGGLFALLSYSHPHYDTNDLYLVSGKCVEIQDVKVPTGKNTSGYIFYVLMDDGKEYYVPDDIWNSLDVSQKNFVGEDIVFFASDKAKHWVYEHLLISFGDDENNCLSSLKIVNKDNIQTKVVVLTAYIIFFPFIIIAPELLYVMEQREIARSKKCRNSKK